MTAWGAHVLSLRTQGSRYEAYASVSIPPSLLVETDETAAEVVLFFHGVFPQKRGTLGIKHTQREREVETSTPPRDRRPT